MSECHLEIAQAVRLNCGRLVCLAGRVELQADTSFGGAFVHVDVLVTGGLEALVVAAQLQKGLRQRHAEPVVPESWTRHEPEAPGRVH